MSSLLARAYIDRTVKINHVGSRRELHLDAIEGLVLLRPDGGRGPAMPIRTPSAMLGTGGEPRPNMSKVEGPVFSRSDGGRGPTVPICAPTVMLGTGGEPRPNKREVKVSATLKLNGEERPRNAHMCPHSPVRDKRRTSS